MIDIHTHILPDVDDGAANLDETVEMLRNLTSLGHTTGFEFLQDMKILLGAENFWGTDFLEALHRQKILPLNKSQYVLIEFHPLTPRTQLLKSAEILLSNGLVPLLAHVERYSAVRKDPQLLRKLCDRGCLTQLNARALEGRSWTGTRRFALRLLGAGLISLIASEVKQPFFCNFL